MIYLLEVCQNFMFLLISANKIIVANLLVGNSENVECLEVIAQGPELLFHSASVVSITGAPFTIEVDGKPREMWSRIIINPKETLNIGVSATPGGRCYIAIKGGFPKL